MKDCELGKDKMKVKKVCCLWEGWVVFGVGESFGLVGNFCFCFYLGNSCFLGKEIFF